jgi:uncharacterized sulfatase
MRYWTVMLALREQGRSIEQYRNRIRPFLKDESPSVRIIAAEALGRYGNDEDLALALPVLLEFANAEKHGVYCAIAALNSIDYLGDKADSIREAVAKLPRKDPSAPDRTASYCGRLIEKIVADRN